MTSKEEAVLLFLLAPICVLLAGMTSNLYNPRYFPSLSFSKAEKNPSVEVTG